MYCGYTGSINLENILGLKFSLDPEFNPKISPKLILDLTAADMFVDYDSALIFIHRLKARQ